MAEIKLHNQYIKENTLNNVHHTNLNLKIIRESCVNKRRIIEMQNIFIKNRHKSAEGNIPLPYPFTQMKLCLCFECHLCTFKNLMTTCLRSYRMNANRSSINIYLYLHFPTQSM